MNATATTTRAIELEIGLEAELDRLLALPAQPVRTTVAASPLCLCWPDGDE